MQGSLDSNSLEDLTSNRNNIKDKQEIQYKSKGLQLVHSKIKNITPLKEKENNELNFHSSGRRSQSSDISNNSAYINSINQSPNNRENNIKTQLMDER